MPKNEQVFLLDGLECLISADLEQRICSAAVRLFGSGARRVRPEFELDPHTLPAVVEICAEAQGMPLAILLAAAWAEMLSPAEILAEMHQGLDFLQAEWADLPAASAVCAPASITPGSCWMSESRQSFKALCIFRGASPHQAAEKVSGASFRTSCAGWWINRLSCPRRAEWYAIHTLLRQFGLEKLTSSHTASQAVHQRYSTYFLDRLAEWEAGLKGARQLETLASWTSRSTTCALRGRAAASRGDRAPEPCSGGAVPVLRAARPIRRR